MNEWMNGWIDGRVDGWMDGRTGGRTMDGCADKKTDQIKSMNISILTNLWDNFLVAS